MQDVKDHCPEVCNIPYNGIIMPRRDGFPTNREMVIDFNTTAREAYVTAFERAIEVVIPPAFEEKPLKFIHLSFDKKYSGTSSEQHVVSQERLYVQPLTTEDADIIDEFEQYASVDESVIEHYRQVAGKIGEATIKPGVHIRPIVPAEGIQADYNAYLHNYDVIRHVSIFHERPAKQTIAAAKYFAEEALDYVQSDEFIKPKYAKRVERELGQHVEPIIEHAFTFSMVPDLPLNGKESRQFLASYHQIMITRAHTSRDRLADMQRLDAPPVIISSIRKRLSELESARLKAEKFLT